MIVHCTARLLKLLAPDKVADVPHAPSDWYANLIWIDRRKCLLIVHADTLFPVFVADVRKPQLAKFADERLASDCLGHLDPTHVQVARTASRSVLGFMNDMASMSERLAARAGGVARLDVSQLHAFLRRTPYNRQGYLRPIDAARQATARGGSAIP